MLGTLHVHGHTLLIIRLLSFISPLLQKLRYLCEVSDYPFFLVLRSSGWKGRHRARQDLDEEVVGRIGVHEEVELGLVLQKRLFDSACHFRHLPSS